MITEFREITEKSMLFKLLLIFVSATFVITFGIGGFFGEKKEVLATIGNYEVLNKEYQIVYNRRFSRAAR